MEKHIECFEDVTNTREFVEENVSRLLAWEYLLAHIWRYSLYDYQIIERCGIRKNESCDIINGLKRKLCIQNNKI